MRPYRPSATPRARALLRSLDREHQTAAGAELKTATAPGLDDDVRIDVDIDPDSAPPSSMRWTSSWPSPSQ
jgi:hypothetical protein